MFDELILMAHAVPASFITFVTVCKCITWTDAIIIYIPHATPVNYKRRQNVYDTFFPDTTLKRHNNSAIIRRVGRNANNVVVIYSCCS